MNTINMFLDSICIGCLSSDRKLSEITKYETKTMFYSFLESSNITNKPISLCFECKAALNRMVHFKYQVNNAQRSLELYLVNQSQLSSLSKLKQTIINNYTKEIKFNDNNHCHEIEFNDNKQSNNDKGMEHFKFGTEFKEFNDKMELMIDKNNDKNELFKISVKIENADDNLSNDGDLAVLSNQEKTEDNHFNDSDEEPLHKLKNGKKPRAKRKQTEKSKLKASLDREPSRVVCNARVERKLRQLNVDSGLIQMIVLTWEEVESERAASVSSAAFAGSQYRCECCAVRFNHRSKLDAHMRKHTAEAGDFMCDVCTIRFKSDKALYAHKRRHRVRWRCAWCGWRSSRPAVCADHVSREHRDARAAPTHTCHTCGDTLGSLTKLKLHMRTHLEPVSCDICGKTFKDKDTLRTHLFIHKGDKEFSCSTCDKKFLFKKALEIHELSHGASQYLYCHQCDESFKNDRSYYQHLRYNLKHIDPARIKYSCSTCGRRFARESRLNEHRRAIHTNEHPVRCDHEGCDKSFPSRSSLRSHRSLAHGAARGVRHVCHRCGHTYKRKKCLESHLRGHSGTREACGDCPKRFSQTALARRGKGRHDRQTKEVTPIPPE